MILQETYTLANGIAIPKLGLGTWFIDNNKAAQAVRTAAELGYRLIDTAQAYGNERGVGEGIRTCGLKREELFVASKVEAEHKTYADAARSIDETLEKMGLTYLDQMLIHSPQPWREFRAEKRYFQENRAVWRALEDAQAAGKVRVIGVSNFLRDDLENLLTGCRVRPAVNQLLLHIAGTAGLLHPAGHPGGGLFPHRPRRGPEKSGHHRYGGEIRRFRAAAVYPLCPAAGSGGPAQDGGPRPYALQRRRGLCHLPGGHGDAAEHGAPDGLRRLQWFSGVQRQAVGVKGEE